MNTMPPIEPVSEGPEKNSPMTDKPTSGVTQGNLRSREALTARSVAYALFSQLVASPHDSLRDSSVELEPVLLPPEDLAQTLERLEVGLPFAVAFDELSAAATKITPEDGQRLAKRYSSLFEVGSEGPPVPLREGWAVGVESSAREEIVRFYEFFGYELAPESSWAPDHLAVELEFMHYLAFAEQQTLDGDVALSFQLAQLDFLERHPLKWLPAILSGVHNSCRDSYLRSLFATLGSFLQHDHSWQSGSLGREG